jgi:hypothetical protein
MKPKDSKEKVVCRKCIEGWVYKTSFYNPDSILHIKCPCCHGNWQDCPNCREEVSDGD